MTRTLPIHTVAMALLLTCVVGVHAQDEDAAGKGSDPDRPATELVELKAGTSLVVKDPETGEVRQVEGVSDEVLKVLQEQARLRKKTQLYELHQLEVSGNTKAGIVTLKAVLDIDILVSDQWVDVPAGLQEFQLTRITHTQKPEDGDAILDKEKLPVKNWLLKGKGRHQLELKLIGETRVSQNGRRRLRIDAPDATISHLTLIPEGAVESAELSTKKPFRIQRAEDSSVATLETWGLDKDTELLWTPALTTQTVATVQTSGPATMELDFSAYSLTITQPLVISGGSIDHLNVRMPDGFQRVSISGSNAETTEIVETPEDSDSPINRIEFTAPVTGPIELKYDFPLEQTSALQELTISQPDIVEVPNESATLDVFVPIGMEVEIDRPDLGYVRHKPVETGRDSRTAVFGFRLLSTRAKLTLRVKATEAIYSVVPQIELQTEQSNLVMTARFAIRLIRGSLTEIPVNWPQYETSGWQILQGDVRLIEGEDPRPLAGLNIESGTLTLPERMSGLFEIEFQAIQPLPEGGTLQFHLPDIPSSGPHSAFVALVDSDVFSMSVKGPEDELFPLIPAGRLPHAPEGENDLLTVHLVDAVVEPLQLTMTPQTSETRVSVATSIDILQGSLHVSQVMRFDVRHKDLSEIRLDVNGVNPNVRLKGSDSPLERIRSADGQLVYGLPLPARGTFDVLVNYLRTPGDDELPNIDIPLVVPSSGNQDLTDLSIGTNASDSLTLVDSDAWQRIYSPDYAAAWKTTERRDSVKLKIQQSLHSRSSQSPQVVVMKSFIRQQSELVTLLTGVYRDNVGSVLFSVPSEVTVVEAWIGDQQTSDIREVQSDDSGSRLIQVMAEVDRTGDSTVTLIVTQPVSGPSSMLSLWQPDAPRIAAAGPECSVIWILGQTTDDSLVYCGRRLTEVNTMESRLFGKSSLSVQSGLGAVLAACHPQVRITALDLVERNLTEDSCQVLVGSLSGRPPVVAGVSRRFLLLLTAFVGLMTYLAILRLRALSLATIVIVGTVAATTAVALYPGPSQLIIVRIAPGLVIALFAAVLQRSLTSQGNRDLSVQEFDQTTIFATEQPAKLDAIATMVGRPAEQGTPS